MCEVAVCEGDDGRHAGARSRVSESECHGMVCERRDTQVCVGGVETTTASDKGRVAAVAILRTAPGLHGGEREVRAVLRTRPPRARLRE